MKVTATIRGLRLFARLAARIERDALDTARRERSPPPPPAAEPPAEPPQAPAR